MSGVSVSLVHARVDQVSEVNFEGFFFFVLCFEGQRSRVGCLRA